MHPAYEKGTEKTFRTPFSMTAHRACRNDYFASLTERVSRITVIFT